MAILQLHSIALDSPAKKQLSPKMQSACSNTHTTCIRQPRQQSSWVPRCHASEHTAATTSHGVFKPWRCLCLLHLFGVTGPARHSIGIKDAKVRKTGARSSNSSSPSSFGTALPSYTTCHKVPSTTCGTMNIQSPACLVLGGSMHTCAQVQLRPRHSATHTERLCKPAGRANEDCRRTFHHKPRHGCQTNLICLHTKRSATSICCSAPYKMIQHYFCCIPYSKVEHDPQALALWTITHIFWHSGWHISHISSNIPFLFYSPLHAFSVALFVLIPVSASADWVHA